MAVNISAAVGGERGDAGSRGGGNSEPVNRSSWDSSDEEGGWGGGNGDRGVGGGETDGNNVSVRERLGAFERKSLHHVGARTERRRWGVGARAEPIAREKSGGKSPGPVRGKSPAISAAPYKSPARERQRGSSVGRHNHSSAATRPPPDSASQSIEVVCVCVRACVRSCVQVRPQCQTYTSEPSTLDTKL